MAALLAVLLLSSCVWKSEYKAKLAEIDGLQTNVAGLEDQIRSRDKDIAGLRQQVSDLTAQQERLEKERVGLQQENANIKSTLDRSRDQLTRDVVNLKSRVHENMERIGALEADLAAKDRAVAQVKGTYDSLVAELKSEIKEGQIKITQLKDKLTVNMVDKILFDSGSAVIKKDGKQVLDRVAEILKGAKDQRIKVEGHTDNVPIGPGLADRFPSNWELSTARATTVVRYLQERGVSPAFLNAEGYAEYQPVAPNDSEENKAQNRRIEIVLVPLQREK
jgi:chemotaxis protein MotB